jgi:uncharacterized protein with GYD domain
VKDNEKEIDEFKKKIEKKGIRFKEFDLKAKL